MKIVDMLFTGIGVVACVEARCVGRELQVEPLEEGERERTTPMIAFDFVFLTQEGADTLPILFCRDNRHGQMGVTCCERKGHTSYLISFLVDCRILLKDENEPSMKVFQEAMIQSCVEVAVREMKRQCRILKIDAGHFTSVRITGDIELLQMARFGEKIWFHKIGEEGIKSFVKRIIQGIFVGHHDRTRAISYITESGIVRGRSRAKQTLSDAMESTNWEDLFDNPFQFFSLNSLFLN